MKGDFSRDTFDSSNHFIRVLMQQGRVQLDADWNEQVAILLHYLQTLAADLIGPHGGWPEDAFKIVSCLDTENNPVDCTVEGALGPQDDFYILPGHYYVKGVLCENKRAIAYTKQPDYPIPEAEELEKGWHLVYLDVWERHITYLEHAAVREVALNGPDTATRAQVVWQVKTEMDAEYIKGTTTCNTLKWTDLVEKWQSQHRGELLAKAEMIEVPSDPCIIPPEARYRGPENQLYRVEIHQGGSEGEATFKWSRDNGAVVFPIRVVKGKTVTLENLGLDGRFSLHEGDWVEIVDDDHVLQNRAESLLEVDSVDRVDMKVTLKKAPASDVGQDPAKHPLLRRWDHKAGTLTEGKPELTEEGGDLRVKEDAWLTLEDGIQIYFNAVESQGSTNGGDGGSQEPEMHQYRTGDYWLIPARTATGRVEWPKNDDGTLKAMSPHGVDHYYAPLAIIQVLDNGNVEVKISYGDCRKIINQVTPQSGT